MTRRQHLSVALVRLWLLACAWMVSLEASAGPDLPRHGGADRPLAPHAAGETFLLRPMRYEPVLVSLADAADPRRVDAASAASIAVIYPDLGEPYRSIFIQIIEGIEDAAGSPVRQYAVGANVDPSELRTQLKRNGVKVAITLGRQGLKAMSGLEKDIAVVAGGVLSVPEAESRNLLAVSLTPDPALLFSRLKNLLPAMRRVIVIYNPQQNEWLIRLAREAAKAHGLELLTHEARDLSSAARTYETAFAGIDGKRDAIWLPQDSTTVDESAVLPMILKESWNRNVPVFSSSFLHVKKGVLFALYPNNVEMGRTLANSAFGILAGDPRRRGVLPLREVNTAVNIRTASHIGLNIGYQQQRSFDYIFPEP